MTVLYKISLWKSLFFNCLIIVHLTLPKNADGFRLAIPKLGLTVHSGFQMDSCNQHLKFKEVSSDSAFMEITMEISVFELFDNFPLNIV